MTNDTETTPEYLTEVYQQPVEGGDHDVTISHALLFYKIAFILLGSGRKQ